MRNGNCYLRLAACVLWATPVLAEVGRRVGTLPPDPANAALLYYQAFLLLPEPNEAEEELVFGNRTDKMIEYLHGAPIPFDPNVEPRLRELEAKYGSSRVYGSSPPHKGPAGRSGARERWELFLLQEKHDRQERTRGVDPNRAIRDYVARCRPAIKLAWDGSELTECDWGVQHSKGIGCPLPQLVQARRLSFALSADASIRAANADIRGALECCLMIRRFGRHVGDDTIHLHNISEAVDCRALRCMRVILGHMEPDVDTLVWLRKQLSDGRPQFLSIADVWTRDFEHVLQSVRNNRSFLHQIHEAMRLKRQIQDALKEHPEKATGDVEITELVEGLTEEQLKTFPVQEFYALMREESNELTGELSDEELIALAAKPYVDLMDVSIAVIESDMPYRDKFARLEDLDKEYEDQYSDTDTNMLMMLTHPEKVLGLQIMIAVQRGTAGAYEHQVRRDAIQNAFMAGIEVYLFKAKTGHLPEVLPEGLPKDPFTGRDFAYTITEEGFSLSLPDKSVGSARDPLWEFEVQ